MGVNHGAQVLHSIKGLSMGDVADICKKMALTKQMETPTIDVDCSNLSFKVGKHPQWLASFLMRWANTGLCIVPVCDARVRPISKQASNKRRAERDKARIKASILRMEIRELRRRLYCDVNDRQQIIDDITNKEKSCKSAETSSTNVVASDLDEKLSGELNQSSAHARNLARGFVDEVMTAEYQADALMMGRVVKGDTLMVMSSDADIPIIAGDECISIKEFTRDGSIEIVSTSKETIEKAWDGLSDKKRERTKINPAQYPIFDGVSDRELRALMALYLGCDVYPKGMVGVGAASLEKVINDEYPKYLKRFPETSLFTYLEKNLCAKTEGFTPDVVQSYIKALIYEPTNVGPTTLEEVVDIEDPAKSYRTYLGGSPPTKLPKYLEEFAGSGTEIYDGPEIVVCKGVGNCSHKFLVADGFKQCKACYDIVCKFCRHEEDAAAEAYCLPCYAQETLVPMPGEGAGKPINEMRDELFEKYNFDSVDKLTMEEVEDYYAVKEVVNARVNGMLDMVPFPVHSTSVMNAELHWKTLVEINISEGGAFISDPELDPKNLPGILHLFASLVQFETKTRTDHQQDPAVYDSMPEMLIEFANKCRVDSGYRLLARTVRHAFDSRITTMDKCSTKLIIDDEGAIGIQLKSKIPASMKKSVYDTEIAATPQKLLCCKCSCQCGSHGDERTACVHTFVRLYLLCLLLHENLAEHILLELAARVNGSIDASPVDDCDANWMWNMSTWSEDELKCMKKSIVLLMEAAGEHLSADDLAKNLPDMLQVFVVGTERRKEWKERTKVPPKPSELGPIAGMKFMSTTKRAALTLKRDAKLDPTESELIIGVGGDEDDAADDDLNEEGSPDSDLSSPQYKKIWSLMEAADIVVDDCKFAGIQLLGLRANAQESTMTMPEKSAMAKTSRKEWALLKKTSKERSVNMTRSQTKNIEKKRCGSPSHDNDSTPPAKRTKTQKGCRAVTPSPTNIATRSKARRLMQELPKRPKKVYGKYMKCHKYGCPVNNREEKWSHIKFHKVPKYPKDLKGNTPRKNSVVNRQGKIFQRRETLRRMSMDAGCMREFLYICERHKFVSETHYIDVKFNNKKWSQGFKLTLPANIGPDSSLNESEESLGNGTARQVKRVLIESQAIMQNGFAIDQVSEDDDTPAATPKPSRKSNEPAAPRKAKKAQPTSIADKLRQAEAERDKYKAEAAKYRGDAVCATLALNQTFEQIADNQHVPMNPTVKRAANLENHIVDPTSPGADPTKQFFSSEKQPHKDHTPRDMVAYHTPDVHLEITDDEVQRRTGFPTRSSLLTYMFIVCNGNVDTLQQRHSSLTWFEEWFLHFEYKWGRTITRVRDAKNVYGPAPRYIRKIIAAKYSIERQARGRWPVYASFEEDAAIRKPKWNDKYSDKRIVMWDMTNINAYGFSDADLQRLTYSKYYNGNVFKGGVFTQLCGWIGTGDLWPGAVSDSDYNKREGYLKRQQQFAQSDLVNEAVLPFTIIYDKGYRAKMVAWKTGKQHVIQPEWAESDRQFGRDDTLRSASVATDRAGNERAVNVCKRAWFISRGFMQNMSPERMNDAWATWSFQANFMFNPVL